jgi:hypothetical protein
MGEVTRLLAAGAAAALVLIPVSFPVTLSASVRGQSVPGVAAPASAIELSTFVSDLERLEGAISQAPPAGLAGVRATIPARWVVRVGEEDIEVGAGWVRTLIEDGERDPSRWPAYRARLLTRLAAVRRDAAAAAVASAPPSAARGRTLLRDTLARREFEAGRTTSWLSVLREKFEQWLLEIWRRLGGERLGQRRTALVLAWMAVLAGLGVLVSWLVKTLLRATTDEALHLTVPEARRKSARAWAREALGAIDPAEAARCAYHAALKRLEEEGTWRMDETRTPREYLRLLPQPHVRRRLVADITHRFEQIRYGARPATAEDVRSIMAHLKELGCLPAD